MGSQRNMKFIINKCDFLFVLGMQEARLCGSSKMFNYFKSPFTNLILFFEFRCNLLHMFLDFRAILPQRAK